MTPSLRTSSSAQRDAALGQLLAHVDAGAALVVVKAPPGSGKTFTLLHAVRLALHRRQRVAVATQTNAQANDFCQRLAAVFTDIEVTRFASDSAEEETLGAHVDWVRDRNALPHGPCVVVAPAAKWSSTALVEAFDVLVVDEAWQLSWAEFTLLRGVAGRFVLVGDPGQIPPVVTVDVARWHTAPRPPHAPAPEVLLRERQQGQRPPFPVLELPVSTRLPFDTKALVQGFYDFTFASWAGPGERLLSLSRAPRRHLVDPALDRLQHGSLSLLTLPTPEDGPPEDDRELADVAAQAVRRLLARRAIAVTEDGRSTLTAADIGLVATHRVVNARLTEALGPLAAHIRVDTPERWQGLERPVMVAIHPLSSVVAPSDFDLETGRLCVMTSRHRVALLLLTRDHVPSTLATTAPPAAQPVGHTDKAGQGHARHQEAWDWLSREGCLTAA